MLALLFASLAFAAPDHGTFDYHRLFGDYLYESCTNDGEPVWGANFDEVHVVISDDPFFTQQPTADYVGLVRYRNAPLLVNWDLPGVNRGVQETRNDKGEVVKSTETYTTADGLFGTETWNFSDVERGWNEITIRFEADGSISYDMAVKYASRPEPVRESCKLKRLRSPL